MAFELPHFEREQSEADGATPRLTPEQVAGEGMARRVQMVGRVWTIAMRIATYNVNGINGRAWQPAGVA